MSIGGKEFNISSDNYYPSLRVDLVIKSPHLYATETRKIEQVMIDTGSDFTLIPNDVVKQIGLVRTGSVREIEDFNGDVRRIKFYAAILIIEGVIEERFEVGAIEGEAVIGMDLISQCHLLISCPTEHLKLSIRINTIS